MSTAWLFDMNGTNHSRPIKYHIHILILARELNPIFFNLLDIKRIVADCCCCCSVDFCFELKTSIAQRIIYFKWARYNFIFSFDFHFSIENFSLNHSNNLQQQQIQEEIIEIFVQIFFYQRIIFRFISKTNFKWFYLHKE